MKEYNMTTAILCLITVVGAYILIGQRGDVHFKDYEYTPEDWVTTDYTLFTTELSNDKSRDEYNYKWQQMRSGVQLKPIVQYRKDYVVVELPDGHRGLVAPSTLSGAVRDGEFKMQYLNGKSVDKKDASRYGKAKKEPTDSTLAFVGFMSAKENYNKYIKSKNSSTKPKDYGQSCVVVKHDNNGYISVKANDLWPNFATGIPIYYANHNDEFKVYVSTKRLSQMNQQEIDSKYGEPISVSLLPNGGRKAFYRHLRTKESYNYKGVFITYAADGTTVVEDPRNNENEYTLDYIANKSRPILSRITSIDWVDLPLAFPFISMFHLNFSDITTNSAEDTFPYFWVFLGAVVYSLLFCVALAYIIISICFRIKSLSNNTIDLLSFIISIIPILIIGTLYMELFQGLWLAIALVTPFIVCIPCGFVSSETEFNRCDFCRNVDCVGHIKTLIDTQVSTRVDTFDYDDTSTSYGLFDDTKTETVIHKRDHTLVETTKKKFRYDFHCSICNKDWDSIKTESKDRTLGKTTTSHGGTRTTWRKA